MRRSNHTLSPYRVRQIREFVAAVPLEDLQRYGGFRAIAPRRRRAPPRPARLSTVEELGLSADTALIVFGTAAELRGFTRTGGIEHLGRTHHYLCMVFRDQTRASPAFTERLRHFMGLDTEPGAAALKTWIAALRGHVQLERRAVPPAPLGVLREKDGRFIKVVPRRPSTTDELGLTADTAMTVFGAAAEIRGFTWKGGAKHLGHSYTHLHRVFRRERRAGPALIGRLRHFMGLDDERTAAAIRTWIVVLQDDDQPAMGAVRPMPRSANVDPAFSSWR
jgi:hypothetical protein